MQKEDCETHLALISNKKINSLFNMSPFTFPQQANKPNVDLKQTLRKSVTFPHMQAHISKPASPRYQTLPNFVCSVRCKDQIV